MGRVTGWRTVAAAGILGIVAGCATPPPPLPPPSPPAPGATAAPPAAAPAGSAATAPSPHAATPDATLLQTARARWLAADWIELPGFFGDRLVEWWPAFIAGCDRPARGWAALCAEARLRPPPTTDGEVRTWLMERTRPWRLEPLPGSPEPAGGLLTGYFEPLVEARRTRGGGFTTPLHAPPADLGSRRPYWTRQELETVPAAMAALRGREIAWVADPLDALVLQIQGSGRLWFPDGGPAGGPRLVRLAFAGHNDQPYRSVGRWLIDQGELRPGEASWPAIKEWARRNPQRVQEMLWTNPRTVFFREETLPLPPGVAGTPAEAAAASIPGPRGAQGVALTPQRSIAVDPTSIPYGTPVWLDSTEPLGRAPLQRMVMAQDTGSAIVGAIRADFFWGPGNEAEQQAGRMKQPLRLWALWPLR